MKGSPRLASRRGAADRGQQDAAEPGVVDASFAPLAPAPVVGSAPTARRSSPGFEFESLNRRLWQAVFLAVILNVALIAALVATRGVVPGIWSGAQVIGPDSSVRVAGAGLVARAAPANAAAIVADLPEGGLIRISGHAVTSEDGLWWPVEVQTDAGPVSGYVPESWVRAP